VDLISHAPVVHAEGSSGGRPCAAADDDGPY
jgi:hypothetical protein